jgi:hypothetical protein
VIAKTYTMYLLADGRVVGFEPAMCANEVDAMRRARELLAGADYDGVDVYFGDERLFGLGRGAE